MVQLRRKSLTRYQSSLPDVGSLSIRVRPKTTKFRPKASQLIPAGKRVAIDTETTGIHPWHGDRVFAISMCDDEGRTAYFEWPVDPKTREVQMNAAEAAYVREWLESSEDVEKVWFHGKFDRRMLRLSLGVKRFAGKQQEVMFAAHIADSSEPKIALKPLAEKYLGVSDEDQVELKKAATRARKIGKKQGAKLYINPANGKSQAAADYWMVPIYLPELGHLVRKYAVLDAQRTMLLWLMYCEVINEMPYDQGWGSYRKEVKLEPIVEGMEEDGLHYSRHENNKLLAECHVERAAALSELAQLSGIADFDPKKPVHVRKLLYEIGDSKGVLPTGLMTKTGLPSTAFKYVQLFKDRDCVKPLLRFKTAQKGITTYFRVFEALALPDPEAGTHVGFNDEGDPLVEEHLKVHPNYNQVRTKTSRFSSSGAGNLQNIPDGISTRAGKTVRGRDIFGPRPGCRWYLADYSQLEVRIFADLSQEPFLLDALAHGRDIHTEAANKAWGNEKGIIDSRATLGLSGTLVNEHNYHEYEKLHAEHKRMGIKPSMLFGKLSLEAQARIAREWLESYDWDIVKAEAATGMKHARAKAKILLFCRMFGGGPNAIKDLLYVSRAEAERFLEDYAESFPRMTEFIDETSALALEQGYVVTRFGRRLSVPRDKSYRGVNYSVQGAAAGLLKQSMLKVGQYFDSLPGRPLKLLLTIHDEIVFEARKDKTKKEMIRTVKRLMEDHGGAFAIPMPVEVSATDQRWPDKAKVKWLADEEEKKADKRSMVIVKKKLSV